jgi:hypothetical protein
MTPENFAYWLNGFVELTQGQVPTPAQWKSIQEHLGEVFKKVTPPVGVKQEVTVPDGFDLADFLKKNQWPGYPLDMRPMCITSVNPGVAIC